MSDPMPEPKIIAGQWEVKLAFTGAVGVEHTSAMMDVLPKANAFYDSRTGCGWVRATVAELLASDALETFLGLLADKIKPLQSMEISVLPKYEMTAEEQAELARMLQALDAPFVSPAA